MLWRRARPWLCVRFCGAAFRKQHLEAQQIRGRLEPREGCLELLPEQRLKQRLKSVPRFRCNRRADTEAEACIFARCLTFPLSRVGLKTPGA